MLKTIALVGLLGIVAVLVVAALRPDNFRVARSATVQAPPDRLHALINDLHQFNTWNPFEKGDPQRSRASARSPGSQFESGLAGLKQRAERT